MTAILVVEDERVAAKNIEEALLSMGYEVLGCPASADECIRRAGERRPDLVLMDVRIQGEMDGIQTAQMLRSRYDVPVVFLTAYADDETLARARETEPHGYILKPFRASELRATVELAVFKHRLESELKDRERWFSTTLRAIGDAVITVDANEKVTFVNRVGQELTGRSAEQLVGHQLGDVFCLVDERTRQPVTVPIREAFAGQSSSRLPPGTALLRVKGELPIEDSVAPIIDETGKLWGAVIVFSDASERRKLEEQVALSDRLSSLGTLAAGVAHEINNPLTYVLGNVSAVLDQLRQFRASPISRSGGPPSEAFLANLEEALGEANEGAEHIRQTVMDLRLFARPESGQHNGDVVATLEWALRVVSALIREHARIELDLAPVPPVRSSSSQLGQVFVNLLINAAQAIPPGRAGENTIRVSTGLDENHRIAVTVTDTGTGMSPEVLKRIFDPFFTTKPVGSGTGLGLSVCHGIVKGIGGEIRVTSSPGQGSTFRVLLPIGETIVPPTREIQQPTALPRRRILIVDDEVFIVKAMKRMLEQSHDVVTATSANQALELLATHARFELVLCDMMMPGMSGIEFYYRIEAQWPELTPRIVFVTGAAFNPEVADFLQSVSNPRLSKPFDSQSLQEFVRAQLLRRSGQVA